MPETIDLAARAADIHWYHVMELAPGVVTKGIFDLRHQVPYYRLPERLDGKRCLDIGSLNGFWAFEMEKRGAAEVIALDLDDEADLDYPPRRRVARSGVAHHDEGLRLGMGRPGFELAHEVYGSSVKRVVCNVYNALPADLGQFDVVFCGSVLIHLRDQLLALERICDLTKDDGVFISAEEYDPWSALTPFPSARYRGDRWSAPVFWQPSIKTWKRMFWTAGFDHPVDRGRFRLETNQDWFVRHMVFHAFKQRPSWLPRTRPGRALMRARERTIDKPQAG